MIHVEADEKPTSAALVAKLVFAWDNKIGEYVHTGVKIVDDEEQRASRTA